MLKDKNFSNILISVLYFVLGVLFIGSTEELLTTFNYILVSICAIIGVIQMIGFFIGKKYKSGNYLDIFVGVVFIWVSLILYWYYRIMINILPILFSLYLFIMGAELFIRYFENKDTDDRRGKYLILGMIAIVVGLLLIFNPGSVIYTYLRITGVYLILVSFMYGLSFIKSLRSK